MKRKWKERIERLEEAMVRLEKIAYPLPFVDQKWIECPTWIERTTPDNFAGDGGDVGRIPGPPH